MKANELMIGDLVVLGELSKSKGEYAKVLSIGDCKIYSNYIGLIGTHNLCHSFEECIDDIEPIPLTEEILKANGFKCRKTYANPRYSYIDDNGHKLISFQKTRQGYEMQVVGNRVRLEYVHELQHALRLCGLNDLADNFKIE